jgi:1-hydroxycarotenoid 3,4-desaturase
MMPKPDHLPVVIVGAGIGGLAAALQLTAAGMPVTVIEAGDEPGGKMRAVAVDGVAIDAGPTVFTMRWVFDELLAQCGTRLDDMVALTPLSLLARHVWRPAGDGLVPATLDLHADAQASADAIAAFSSPSEANRFLAFCEQARRTYQRLEGPHIRSQRPSFAHMVSDLGAGGLAALAALGPFASLWASLGRHFHDPRLRQLFGRYATYCGASPWLAPATLMLIAHVEMAGVWSIQGGMPALARALADLAKRQGAQFQFGRSVQRIVVEQGRVQSVQLSDGSQISAQHVIFNGDVNALACGLLGPALKAAAPKALRPTQRSLSALTWALNVQTEGLPLARHNVFFDDHYQSEFDDVFVHRRLPRQGTVYVCAQDRLDQRLDPRAGDGKERLLVLVNAPADGDKQALDGEEIRACEQRSLELMSQCGLKLKVTSATPVVRRTPSTFNQLHPGSGGGVVWGVGARVDGLVQALERAHQDPRPVPGGRQRASGAGGADGSNVGAFGGSFADGRPRFDQPLAPTRAGAYRWWYVDGVSADGQHALTIIAFIGSVFSPYYRRALALSGNAGTVNPLDHCAINVCLYSPGKKRWAMTERAARHVKQSTSTFTVGPSHLHWDGQALHIELDERATPIPYRVRGRVTVTPHAITDFTTAIDHQGRHRWHPIAPSAHLQVRMNDPDLQWEGSGYADANEGDEPITRGFTRWDWLRTCETSGATTVVYDVDPRGGLLPKLIARRFNGDGTHHAVDVSGRQTLAKTPLWRVERQVRSWTESTHLSLERTLEDTPFYARSMVKMGSHLDDPLSVLAMHETLDAHRLESTAVQWMLPWRMPRRR